MAERIGQAHQPGGNLQIEEVARSPAAPKMAEAHLLPARVDDDHVGGIDDDVPKGVERSRRHRVDQEKCLESGYLDKAEAGMIRLFADELRIKAERRASRQVRATFGQFMGLGDNLFG